jgi:hypothetical protein
LVSLSYQAFTFLVCLFFKAHGLGMRIVGGFECEDGSLGCYVVLVIKGGPADINSIESGKY